jgi:hypothetical protein
MQIIQDKVPESVHVLEVMISKTSSLGTTTSSARISGVPDYQMPHQRNFSIFASLSFEYE